MIPYGRQEISDADVTAVGRALRDPLLTQGPKVAAFEVSLTEVTGARFAVAFNSGTAALHAAYAAAGVGRGKTVLTSPITFVATANAALYLQGSVRFVDVDPLHVMMSPELVEQEREPNIAVLAPVHFGGHVAPMEQLAKIARMRNWVIVEDAAHALGARYLSGNGIENAVGACAHSDMCCFSFHPVKHITTGEGGAVTTNDAGLAARLRRFRTHGITRDPGELTAYDGPWYYEQLELGFNYRITDIQCALGISQLARLQDFVDRRRAIAGLYDREFEGLPGLRVLSSPPGSRSAYHLYVVRVNPDVRRRVFERLRQAGIGVNVHYIPVYRQPYYRMNGFANLLLPNAERYYSEALTIPLFPSLRDEEVRAIVQEVRRQVNIAG